MHVKPRSTGPGDRSSPTRVQDGVDGDISEYRFTFPDTSSASMDRLAFTLSGAIPEYEGNCITIIFYASSTEGSKHSDKGFKILETDVLNLTRIIVISYRCRKMTEPRKVCRHSYPLTHGAALQRRSPPLFAVPHDESGPSAQSGTLDHTFVGPLLRT